MKPGVVAWYALRDALDPQRVGKTRTWEHDVEWERTPRAGSGVGVATACQIATEGGGGYVIFLHHPDGRHEVVFSLWHAQDGGKVEGASPNAKPFGGEGEGVQCPFPLYWKKGVAYRVRLMAVPTMPPGGWVYHAYVRRAAGRLRDRLESHVGAIRCPASYGAITGAATWIEHFWGPDGCLQPRLRATWSGPVVDRTAAVLREVGGNVGACVTNDIAGTVKEWDREPGRLVPVVTMETGVGVVRRNDPGALVPLWPA